MSKDARAYGICLIGLWLFVLAMAATTLGWWGVVLHVGLTVAAVAYIGQSTRSAS